MNPYEYDVAQFVLENGTQLKEEVEPFASRFYELKPYFMSDDMFLETFNQKYKDFFCMLLVEKLVTVFSELTYEDLRVMVTPEFVEELNGEDYFEYE